MLASPLRFIFSLASIVSYIFFVRSVISKETKTNTSAINQTPQYQNNSDNCIFDVKINNDHIFRTRRHVNETFKIDTDFQNEIEKNNKTNIISVKTTNTSNVFKLGTLATNENNIEINTSNDLRLNENKILNVELIDNNGTKTNDGYNSDLELIANSSTSQEAKINGKIPEETNSSNVRETANSSGVQYLPHGQYVDISASVKARPIVSHEPEIKQTTDGKVQDTNSNVKKFTIQDTFSVLKDLDAEVAQDSEISMLIKHVMKHYLSNCMIIFLYDELFYTSVTLRGVITEILEYSPLPVMHGMINTSGLSYHISTHILDPPERKCRNFIILTKNLENSAELLGRQRDSKIVFVAYMSSYQIRSFLMDPLSHNIVNLLIIADPNLQHDEFVQKSEFYSIDMFTHRLYTDSLGASVPWILTSWRNGNLTRPWVNLFPDKLNTGFCGHRFIVSVTQQPPYIFRRQTFEHDNTGKMIQIETDQWDGLEVQILKHMSDYLNMTIDLRETSSSNPGDGGPGRVIYEIMQEKATIGLAGMAMTNERLHNISFSASHSQDCAAFLTRTSLALSKYRAIFGPFKWEVWVCLVLVYLIAIVPLSFSDKLTLRHLWEKPSEIENMFWYMFGTFTNLFTFRNTNSWTSSKKASTRAFVGTYWVFSIIITAAYTGSIIAFITLPVFPETIDTLRQLKDERYRIITLDSGGWQNMNNTEKKTVEHEVFEDWELVPKIEDGLRNVTKGHLLWSYAFLGSKAQLEYIIKNNFESNEKKKRRKKNRFHISKQCFQPLYLSLAYPKSSLLNTQLDRFILKAQQTGLVNKWMRDVQWDNWRNEKGGRLQAGSGDLKITVPEDRMLTLDDTLGMFLLLTFGFTLALLAFLNECLTHYNKHIFCCKQNSPHPPLPAITFTPADNVTPVTSVENLHEETTSVSVYDLSSPEHRELIKIGISPHRRYSMVQIDDKILVDWAKRRFSY